MKKVTRIGMDTSKSVFQLHGVDASEEPVLVKKLQRRQVLEFFQKLEPTKIALEACGGAHHWARELKGLGHEAMLIAPQDVKAYVRRGKHDAADAEAICEAMSRPRTRFVPVKTAEQQAGQMLVGVRDGLIRRRTQLTNEIRGYAAEFGLVTGRGLAKIEPLLVGIASADAIPRLAKELFDGLGKQCRELQRHIEKIEKELMAFHRQDETSKRLAEMPSVGPIGSILLAIKAPDPKRFRSGRDFAAWIGLTPKNHSTAGKNRLGVITRAGDEMLRSTLVVGATAYIQHVRLGRGEPSQWLIDLLKRKPPKLAAVALANKTARIAWKLMVTGERYCPDHKSIAPCSAPSRPRSAPLTAVAQGPALTAPALGAPASS